MEPRIYLAAVAATTPGNLGIGVAVDAHISVKFATAMKASTITTTTYRVLDSANHVIAGRVSYNAFNLTATFDSTSPLAYQQTYQAVVTGGSSGVKDSSNGTLSSNFTWTFTTASSPQTGTGGPILVITSAANPFSTYYAEILRAEGLNEFATADIGTLTASTLDGYSMVILSEMSLTASQVTTLGNWVTAGGNLIAMRPDKQLASLLGLTDATTSQSDSYLLIDTSTSPGVGLTDQTIQYHGSADEYTLSGATTLATLFSSATTSTAFPAVTLRKVASNGGQVAAFTYDLAKSIVYTRQGNPAWSGQERDLVVPIRSDDLFFGPNPVDPQPNWVDLNKVQIPQADEQQRLLANLIEQMNLATTPLPRLWYLPNGSKAVIVLTGDDHATGITGTANQFADYLNAGTSGGQPVRGTTYMYTGSLTDAQAAQFIAQGFEVALHPKIVDVGNNPRNWTSMADLASIFATQLSQFKAAYPSIPSPITSRTHAVIWSDYDSQPQVEFSDGIRLDTNYYYWPGTWTLDRPGMFTGSGLPMRFTKADGTMIDVYQATTQLVDENTAQTWPYEVNTLLDNATGPLGYYGAFTVQAHNDNPSTTVPDAVISAAKAHNVAVITADQLLNFTDARNGSYFSALSWNAASHTMAFTITAADGASSVQAMLPLLSSGGLAVASLTRNGTAVPFTVQTIKGIAYAFFNAATGSYLATYAPDTTPPTITATTPVNGATAIRINAPPAATFSEDVRAASIVMIMTGPGGTPVPGTMVYDSASHTASFYSLAQLTPGTSYTVTVSAAKDIVGNSLTVPANWSFTTLGIGPFTLWNSSAKPAVASASDTSAVELGVKFLSDVAGLVTGVSFYKGSLNIGTHIGSLWTAAGTLLARATFGNETASGWQQVLFASPVTIAPNTLYVVSYHATRGGYSDDQGFFTSGSVDNVYLHAPLSSLSDGNGVYTYSANAALPTQTYNATNYWVQPLFTISSNAPTNNSFWSNSATPSVPAANDPGAVEVGMQFQSSLAGSITAITFYKGTGNTGIHVGHLWTADGTLLATVTFTNETASGWQTATLSSPVDISAHTTYIVSYYAPNGHYAADANFFANPLTNGPLTAPSDPSSGGNGVYAYGTGTLFPNQSYRATNYWVDVVLTT